MIKIFKMFKKEEGSAIIFAVMGSLITLALAFILMASTTQNLNVAYFSNNDIKLNSAAETGTSTAVSLINSGYDFTQHGASNPYVRERTILSGAEYKTVERISWYVEPFNIAGDTFCTDNSGLYTPGELEFLIVGGGGSGGGSYGAGGGAGGVIESSLVAQPGEYRITVGAGGAPADVEEAGNAGGDSSGFDLTAVGGGGGAAVKSDGTVMSPLIGGSGGGATISSTSISQQSGALGTPGQGNNGGDSTLTFSTSSAAAGGGGATSAGGDGQMNIGGNGGDGISSSITGTQVFYAAGGGGSAPTGQTAGSGGSTSLGGDGGTGINDGTDGQPNTGSGGGGSYSLTSGTSGAGADGIVIIKYPTEINGYTIPVLAIGGTITELTVGNTKYNIHSFTEPGTSTFNLITTGELKHNCGYELYVTAEMPAYSDEAEITTKTILTPMQYNTASVVNGVITYQPTQTSLFRNGIHANGVLTLEDGVNLYTHYSKDSYNNNYNVLTGSSSLNSASLGSGEKITIDSLTVSQSDIMNATVHHVSGGTPGTYVHAECEYNGSDCTENIINELNFKINETAHNTWIDEQCETPLTSFSSTATIPAGITCVEASSITLATNPVEGTYENPSVLIVKGNLTFDTNTVLNPYRPARTLQIYATGNIDNNTDANSTSSVNALIAATGLEGNISFEELNETSSFTLNGATYSSGNTSYSGNITIWQDLNAKFIRNINDKTLYQRNTTETESYVRESFSISNMGGVFGDTWSPDTSASNVNTGVGG